MGNKKHLPMMGVGPVYVAVTIALTVITVAVGRSVAFEKGRVPFLKIPLLITGILLIVLGVYLWAGALFRSKIDSHIAQNRLAANGVYALVRNPIYSAFMYGCAYDCWEPVFSAVVLHLLDIYDNIDEMHGGAVAEKLVWQGI